MRRKLLVTVLLPMLFIAGCEGSIQSDSLPTNLSFGSVVGEQGIPGVQGIPGEEGPKGEKGPDGPKGEKGETGSQGYPGYQGDKGDTGDKGPVGEQGPQGEQGIQGPQGIQGEKGPTGDKGPDGEKGDTPTFTVAIDKTDNTWVINGVDTGISCVGEQGIQGQQGAQGDKGDTGATNYGNLFSVTYIPSLNGYIQATKAKYEVDEDVVFNIHPNKGYKCTLIEVNQNGGVSIDSSATTYTIKMVSRGLVVRAEFAPIK